MHGEVRLIGSHIAVETTNPGQIHAVLPQVKQATVQSSYYWLTGVRVRLY